MVLLQLLIFYLLIFLCFSCSSKHTPFSSPHFPLSLWLSLLQHLNSEESHRFLFNWHHCKYQPTQNISPFLIWWVLMWLQIGSWPLAVLVTVSWQLWTLLSPHLLCCPSRNFWLNISELQLPWNKSLQLPSRNKPSSLKTANPAMSSEVCAKERQFSCLKTTRSACFQNSSKTSGILMLRKVTERNLFFVK